MKKRRMKLLALMLTAAVTITSVLPVGAAATDGSEVPQQVTSLTDPLDEGSGATDNGLGMQKEMDRLATAKRMTAKQMARQSK